MYEGVGMCVWVCVCVCVCVCKEGFIEMNPAAAAALYVRLLVWSPLLKQVPAVPTLKTV